MFIHCRLFYYYFSNIENSLFNNENFNEKLMKMVSKF